MKKLLLLFGCFNYCFLLNAQDMDLIYYNTDSVSVFSTNNFKSVGIGKGGYVWAGTANQGLYKFNGNYWEKSGTFLTNHNIADIKTDRNGGIWIGQYGSTGAQATGGGINYFPDTTFSNTFYTTFDGIPTRNVRSLYINNKASNVIYPAYRVWSANMADITGGQSRTGAVGIGRNDQPPVFQTRTVGVETVNEAGSCQTIGGNGNEVWVFASNNFGRSQLLRYDFDTTYFIGAYDDLTTDSLPAGFMARAIYFDNEGRGWVGMFSGGVYVFENNVWHHINFSDIFPSGTIVNFNAITGDKSGRVYIGTSNGLVVYNGGVITDNSSYKRYTGNNDFQLGSVQAIAIDTLTQNLHRVILATTNGIARWNIINNDPIEVFNIKNGNPSLRRGKFEYNKQNENIMIAADSTISTLFKVILPNANQYTLRIKNDITATNTEKYGKLILYQQYNDSILYLYDHPSVPDILIDKFSRKEILQVINTTTGDIYHEEIIEFVRPPLLLVHGINSNGNNAFGNMKKLLVNGNLYRPDQIYLANYPSFREFAHTLPFVISDKNKALDRAVVVENISCGKIDVAGHSMGGLLLRLYLQHSEYKNDINKYVSFNSPHMGSPVANYAKHILNLNNQFSIVLNMFSQEAGLQGALQDLRVNSDPVVNRLIGNVQNEVKVPTHAIVTTKEFPWWLNPLVTNLRIISFEELSFLTAIVEGRYNYWDDVLFAGVPHDLVVSEISQKAGLTLPFISSFTNQGHSSTGGPNTDVLQKFKVLLSISADDNSYFTKDGFKPTRIPVPDSVNLARIMQPQAGTLEITDPADNSTHNTGSNITLDFTYTLVDTMIFVMSNNSNPLYAARIDAPATSFSFDIPDEYFGKVKIQIMGFNGSGFSAMDSLTINVGSNAVLENLSFDPEEISVPRTGYALITINGLFDDQVLRNLTGHEGISYSFAHNKATFQAPNEIIGLEEGLDTLTVSFQGKSAILPIEITSQSNWILLDNNMNPLPTKLGSLSARLRNSTVSLEWKAYEDLDVSIYEVQHSKDGARFTTIGHVNPAHVSTERTYQYTHPDYVTGNNFYRIKATEFNGKVIYTNIATVRVNSHLSIKLAPNPVRHTLEIIVNAKKEDIASIIITDVSGKNVYLQQHRINNGINNISIPAYSLANGLYMLRMETTTEKISEKFIKTD